MCTTCTQQPALRISRSFLRLSRCAVGKHGKNWPIISHLALGLAKLLKQNKRPLGNIHWTNFLDKITVNNWLVTHGSLLLKNNFTIPSPEQEMNSTTFLVQFSHIMSDYHRRLHLKRREKTPLLWPPLINKVLQNQGKPSSQLEDGTGIHEMRKSETLWLVTLHLQQAQYYSNIQNCQYISIRLGW